MCARNVCLCFGTFVFYCIHLRFLPASTGCPMSVESLDKVSALNYSMDRHLNIVLYFFGNKNVYPWCKPYFKIVFLIIVNNYRLCTYLLCLHMSTPVLSVTKRTHLPALSHLPVLYLASLHSFYEHKLFSSFFFSFGTERLGHCVVS